ncbi:MAG: biopolymer transporter ExbD, partial [Burkholderiaceae bacterium]|nr:biopolymer transporter ExbD [Burkholderiaceae bacterium]
MNFRRGIRRDEPEINFIPLIDVLLVILIFLMVTTTYSKFTELQVDLPSANAEQATE